MPPKKSMAPWIALGAVALLLLAGVAAAALYFFVLAKPAPHLARCVPKTTSVYVELPGFQRSLVSAAGMKPLDSSRMDEKQMTQDTIVAFSKSFSLTQDDAKAVVSSLDAGAFAARDTNGAGKAAILISFSSAGGADKLLKSARFSEEGPFPGGGVRYTVTRRPYTEVSPNAGVLEEGLSSVATGLGKDRSDVVWFAKKKLLVIGDDSIVTDIASVLDGSADSLETNESYKSAKRTFESGSDVAFFFDTHDWDDVRSTSGKKLLDGYLKKREPMTGAVKLVKAGLMMDMHATLTGSGVPPEDFMAHASIALHRKLPADTVAYMAFSTKTKMKSAAIRAMLLENIAANDPAAAKEFGDGLVTMETTLGFKLDDVIDMTGDDMAIGIILDPSFKLDTSNGFADELGSVGMVYALTVKDDAKAKLVLTKLRAQVEAPSMASVAKVRSLGPNDWEVDPETPATFPVPNLTVRYDGKMIVAVVAAPALSARAFSALQSGKDTLAGNPAHELAIGAMPNDANFYMWLDTGRITSVMMDGATHVKRGATKKSPLPIDAIRLTGPDRVTSALAVRASVKNGAWSVDLDSLNMPATALFSVAKELDLSSAVPSGDLFGPGPTPTPGTRR